MSTTRLFVSGSRSYVDEELIYSILSALHHRFNFGMFISGGARGVDTLAENWARKNFEPSNIVIIKPDYEHYPPHIAPKVRNSDMINLLSPENDVAVFFFDKDSTTGGTKDAWDKVTKKQIKHTVRITL